jgi:WD40 repeat protein
MVAGAAPPIAPAAVHPPATSGNRARRGVEVVTMAPRLTRILATLALALLLAACGTAALLPGTTPMPPTSTAVPPASTPIRPTATTLPTKTLVPSTATPVPPASTPAPPAPTAAVPAGLPGATITVLTGHNSVSALQWSPDGRTLASGDFFDGSVRLWSADGTALATLTGHQGRVFALAWDTDGDPRLRRHR